MTNLEKILLGNAKFTLVSKKTGTRYTYNVIEKRGQWLVYAMTGCDNDSHFNYLGWINSIKLWWNSPKSHISLDAPIRLAFSWWFSRGCESEFVEFYPAGKCFKCGRTLTTPESILSGIGPKCGGK